MDALRVAKVEGVLCTKGGSTSSGTLHLTAHHAIFHHEDEGKEEMWVPYPLISLVSRMPMTMHGRCPLTIHTRTFETTFFLFSSEKEAIDVFESVKELTVATSVTQLYAFFYVPNPPLPTSTGWTLYTPREEFGRMGVGTRTKAWRFTDINKDYSFSPTYPARLVVPTRISDTTLQYAVKYRSKGRLPVLTYLHWANYGTITRSSQPMVGLTSNRSIQDEKLIEAIFQTHHNPESRVSAIPVYGATATNIIVDARPTANAMANTAKGAGTENMDHYKEAKKAYLGIDNIHGMRESLAKVVEALRATEIIQAAGITDAVDAEAEGTTEELPVEEERSAAPVLDRQALRRSGWMKHIIAILEGALVVVRNVHVNSSHVLVHCSDGWDRTAQLTSISQLCLDPYYRSMKGFAVLVEKDWLSFGHKFLDRCGHLSSEKFFLAPVENAGSGGGAEAAQAFLASVQNRFASQHHIRETSPVFHQFLESVRQIQRQYPERFEFNERYLRQLHHHLYACQFGTFMFDTERERRVPEPGQQQPYMARTISVWDLFNSPAEMELNKNPLYDPSLDDPASRAPKADQGVLMPNPKDVRFWHELYGRTDEEMNGKFVVRPVEEPELAGPVEGADETPALAANGIASATVAQISIQTPQAIARFLQGSGASTPSPAATPLPDSPSSSTLGPDTQPSPSPSPSPSAPPRTPSPSVRTVRGSSAAPRRASTSPPAFAAPGSELFSSGGVRSLWGRVSSGATTALSAVQDAYGGLAKDLRGLSLGDDDGPSSSGRGGELKSRSELANPWGADDARSSYTPSLGPARAPTYAGGSGGGGTVSSNPWAAPATRPPIPSMYMENPWGSVRASIPGPGPAAASAASAFAPGPATAASREPGSWLVADPHVQLPGSVAASSRISQARPASRTSTPPPVPPKGPGQRGSETEGEAAAAAAASDPLGVAAW
ncbi:phosphatases II [Epithele typhae]|uniref:phosphatases II n=1 Tax=Epithele typhae TaxID=378194 RepID=UPI0020078B03|nr:phosphatases II [Epithele typhae]KAH9928550.1 phosphatases II [Epithele typhae]